jgi:hypothetical protein
VKFTFAPAHTAVPDDDEMFTEGTSIGLTVIVMLLLVSTEGTKHPAEAVTIHVMISLFASVAEEYVGLLVPTAVPFLFH